jgi:predicted RNA binding protein YcfA (HicA-like mRNA interferase family)
MPKLKKLSGQELVKIFNSFGFEVKSQKGSHIKLRRVNNSLNETLIIPNHKELDTGTLRAIVRQASQYIEMVELVKHFYI